MKPTVLLRGAVTEESLNNAWGEIAYYKKCGETHVVMVINSEGGNGTKALEFIEKIKECGLEVSVKIYHAESAAALIALASSEREIVKNGRFVIHLGSVEVESCDISQDGTIPKGYQVAAKKFRDEMFKAAALPPGHYIDRLLATNRLTLTAEECLELGIVQRIVG